jgi:arylsulfatase A-like enzyme
MPRQPNLVLILSDEHRFDCTGLGAPAGWPHGRVTPHLDALAAGGSVFRHAFTPVPICCPARQSLLTGQWPFIHQALTNYDNGELQNALSADAPVYSRPLAAAGYALDWVGKWHMHPTLTPCDFAFDHYVSSASYVAWRAEQDLPPVPMGVQPFQAVDPVPVEASRKHWLTSHAIDIIRQRAAQQRPFHLVLALEEPHHPSVVPEPFASLIDPAEVPAWGSFGDPLTNKPWIQRQMLHHWNLQGRSWANWAPVAARYLGDVAHVDHQIGRIVEALRTAGVFDDTLLIYSSDHGDMGGAHGMFDKHNVLYDDVVRVPLYVSWPASFGTAAAGAAPRVIEPFVCNCLDIPATLLAAAGSPAPATMQGRSLLPLLHGPAPAAWPDSAYTALHGSQFGLNTQRMVRDHAFKYIFNATAIDELYDLERDPHELTNLVPLGTHADVLRHYREKLLAWGDATRDPLLLNKHMRRTLTEGRLLDEM